MKEDRKKIRTAAVCLHAASLILAVLVFLLYSGREGGLPRALLFLLALFLAAEAILLRYSLSLSQETESDLYRSRIELLQQQLSSNEDKLNALQSQINPHFLYNTLETIRGMALEKGEKEIAKIVASLSLLFRYAMDFSNTLVPIELELAHIERYMKIQQLRFPGRFTLQVLKNCEDSDLHEILIPKFSLQPLIENAVGHAFRNMREGCVLKLRLTVLNERITMVVEDNGSGMGEEEVRALNESILYGRISQEESTSHNGIGLHNIYSRLRLYFGEDVSMYVYSAKEVGTMVTLDIPIKRNG